MSLAKNVSYAWCGSLLLGCTCPSCHHGGYRTRDQLLCVSNFQPNLHLYCASNYFWSCSVLFHSWRSRFSSIPLFSSWRRIHVYAHIKIFNSTTLCLSNYCKGPYPFILTVLSVRVWKWMTKSWRSLNMWNLGCHSLLPICHWWLDRQLLLS